MKKLLVFFLLLFLIIPVKALTTSGEAVILMDQDSGRILYSKNINRQKLIASTTKIMTAILAVESNKLDKTVKIDESILKAYGSNIYIEIGEEIKLRDLVYGLMMRSGNDAALAIANYLGGLETFVQSMNDKATYIGMKNTHFINPHGLDEEKSNISTAYDMALLTKYANSLEEYRKIVGTKTYQAKTNYKTYVWTNKNKMLSSYKYTTGGKTGFTEKAKRTLVTSATKEKMNLIVVTLNDPNDWQTHKDLYEYGFDNYRNYLVLNKDRFNVDSDYYKEKLYIENNYYYPLTINETNDITIKIALEKLKRYNDKDKVGEAIVYYKNKEVHKENIFIALPSQKKVSFWEKIRSWFFK